MVTVRIRNVSEEPVWSGGLWVWSHWGAEAQNVFTPLGSVGETQWPSCTLALPKEMSINPPVELVFTNAAGRTGTATRRAGSKRPRRGTARPGRRGPKACRLKWRGLGRLWRAAPAKGVEG